MRSTLETVNVWQNHAAGPVPHTDRARRSEVVVGDGLVLTRDSRAGYGLHAFVAGEMRRIGTYSSTADAWQAVDEIDAEAMARRAARRRG